MSEQGRPICILCHLDDGISSESVAGRDQTRIRCPRCGTYAFDRFVPRFLESELKGQEYILSGVIRARAERGDEGTILLGENAKRLIATAPVPKTSAEYVDRLLLYAARNLARPWDPIIFEKERNYPLLFMKSAEDLNGFVNFAGTMGYMEVHPGGRWKFTREGWERMERLREAQPRSHQAFVAMWFDPSLDPAWEHGLKPGIEDSNYFKAIRGDRAHYLGKVDDWIIAQIRLSGMLVADFTENRGGVYYEAGFAMALGLPVVFTCREDHMKDVHFDTNHFPHITWKTPEELRSKLNDKIVAVVLPEVEKRERYRTATGL